MKKGLTRLLSLLLIPAALSAGELEVVRPSVPNLDEAVSQYTGQSPEVRTNQYNAVVAHARDFESSWVEQCSNNSDFRKGFKYYPGKTQEDKKQHMKDDCFESHKLIIDYAFTGKNSEKEINDLAHKLAVRAKKHDPNVNYESIEGVIAKDAKAKVDFYTDLFKTSRTNFNEAVIAAFPSSESYSSILQRVTESTCKRYDAMHGTLNGFYQLFSEDVFKDMCENESKLWSNGTNLYQNAEVKVSNSRGANK